MLFPVLVTFCILVGGWAFLGVLGNERQRKVQERDLNKPPAGAETPVGRPVSR